MQTEPTIASHVVRSLCDALEGRPAPSQQVLARFGLSSVLTDDAYHRVPLKRYLKMFHWLADELNEPNLGLEISARTGVETIGAVGYLFLSSANLEMAFRSLVRNIKAIQDVSHMDFTVGTRYALVSYRVAHQQLAECRQDNEYSLAFMWRLVQLFSGNRCPLVQVDFEHAPPPDAQYHRRFFRAPVLFNQPNNNLYFHRSALQTPSAALDSHLFPILEQQVSQSLAQREKLRRFSDQVTDILGDDLLREGARAGQVADRLGISTATLNRRLRAEGQTFKRLLDERCKLLAGRMMSQESLPVSTVARRLGYAETACLTRAFRRWYGMTPRQFRHRGDTSDEQPDAGL